MAAYHPRWSEQLRRTAVVLEQRVHTWRSDRYLTHLATALYHVQMGRAAEQ
jgi:hypothetical protein